MKPVERGIENLFFASRWLMAPFLAGLIIGLVALLYKFCVKLFAFVTHLKDADQSDVIVGILSLIDFSLTANLILIVICSPSKTSCARSMSPTIRAGRKD
ncbi:YqhA family protein [Methylocella silvestris]|uniref:YqhA family protein n=1 Tax=Methylocella silvestris TaxID=199596 RepID=UPI0026892C13